MCQKKHPSLGSLFSSPLPFIPRTHQFLEHHSAEGAIICQWGSPKDRSWSWEIGDTWCPGDRAKLFQPRGSTILGVKWRGFSAAEPTWIWRLGAHADSKRPSRSIIGSTFPATCSQLCLPRDLPVLKPKPAQAPGM